MLNQQVVYCPICERDVPGVIHAQYDNPEAHYATPYEESYHRYSFVSCPGCKHPFVTVETGHLAGSCFTNPGVLFPRRGETVSPAVPERLRNSYYEAQNCFHSYFYRATSVLCRSVIEFVADEKGIKGRTLHEKLLKLRDAQFLNQDLFNWANGVKNFGNTGAHEMNADINHADAQDALDLVKAILDYVYSLREKFDRFKERHGAAT